MSIEIKLIIGSALLTAVAWLSSQVAYGVWPRHPVLSSAFPGPPTPVVFTLLAMWLAGVLGMIGGCVWWLLVS